jgi:hypothetical protein
MAAVALVGCFDVLKDLESKLLIVLEGLAEDRKLTFLDIEAVLDSLNLQLEQSTIIAEGCMTFLLFI